MQPNEYAMLDATEMASMVRRGDVTPDELEAAAREACRLTNNVVRAVVEVFPEGTTGSLAAVAAAPFAGVPLLVKDAGIHVRGRFSEQGSRLHAGFTAERDSPLAASFAEPGSTSLAALLHRS